LALGQTGLVQQRVQIAAARDLTLFVSPRLDAIIANDFAHEIRVIEAVIDRAWLAAVLNYQFAKCPLVVLLLSAGAAEANRSLMIEAGLSCNEIIRPDGGKTIIGLPLTGMAWNFAHVPCRASGAAEDKNGSC